MGRLLWPSPSYIERITNESSHNRCAEIWIFAIVKSLHNFCIIHAHVRQYDECLLGRDQ
jgi:hypothetical protein